MRVFAGYLVLFTGVAGLGYYATTTHAVRMQATVDQGAQAVTQAAQHGVQSTVSGRDVRVTGLVTDATDLAVLRATLEGVDGVRVVDMTGVETLPVADPFELIASRIEDGTTTLSGVIPSEADRDTLGGDAAGLVVSAGAPDRDWTGVAARGIAALGMLKAGEMVLSGQNLWLHGMALNPDVVAALRAELDPLPEGYTATFDIGVEDDGRPLRLNLSLQDGVLSGGGKLPVEMADMVLSDGFGGAEPLDLTQSVLPAADPIWPATVQTALDALAHLIDGALMIEDHQISLVGVGTPDGKAQAEALVAGLPDTYEVQSEIGLWDDGAPLSLVMDWDGATATARGKIPDAFTVRGPAGVAVVNGTDQSFLSDVAGDFTRNATAGVTALGLLTTGQVSVTADAIVLDGSATSPQVEVVMDSVLDAVSDSADITRNITYLDDGSPAAWTLTYSALDGASVEGRLPAGLALQDVSDALGAGVVGTPAVAATDADSGSSLDVLGIAASYLPELETLTYARDGGGSALDLVVSPGVDVDLVAIDLAQRLPADVAFSIAPLDAPPTEGTTRRNAATGLTETFTGGYWIPSLDFTADVAGCTAQVEQIIASNKITFLSGSARLDATSIRAINGLAAVARSCVEAGLSLDIGGHTDNTGDEAANQALSFERASAVQDALEARGIQNAAMTAAGFGQSQPIADNETEEGRAANRRTSLIWIDPLTP